MIWSACYDFHVCQDCEPRRTPPATWPQLRPMQQGGTSRRCPAPPWSCRGARPPSTSRPTEPTLSLPTTTSNQTKPQSSSLAQLSNPLLLASEQKPSRWIVAWNPPSVLSLALFCPPPCPPVPHHAPCHHQPLTACSTLSHPNCPTTPDPPALQPASKAGHGNLLSYRLYVTYRALFYIHAT